jgi:hypothetical protein
MIFVMQSKKYKSRISSCIEASNLNQSDDTLLVTIDSADRPGQLQSYITIP